MRLLLIGGVLMVSRLGSSIAFVDFDMFVLDVLVRRGGFFLVRSAFCAFSLCLVIGLSVNCAFVFCLFNDGGVGI